MPPMTHFGFLQRDEQHDPSSQGPALDKTSGSRPGQPLASLSVSSLRNATSSDAGLESLSAKPPRPSFPNRPSQVFSEAADLGTAVWPTSSIPVRQGELETLLAYGDEEQGLLHRPNYDSTPADDGMDEDEDEELKMMGRFAIGGRILRRTSNSLFRPARTIKALFIENLRRLLGTNLYHTSGAIFVPLGLLSYFLSWHFVIILILNALALGTCSFLAAALFEDLRHIRRPNLARYSFIGEVIWTNPAWLCIGAWAVYTHEYRIVQFIIPGSILTRSLLGLGLGCLSGSMTQRVQNYNPAAVSTTTSLKMVGVVPLVICSLLTLAYLDDDGSAPTASRSTAILIFSRGAAITSVLIYMAYWLFRNITHASLFSSESLDDESAATTPAHPHRPSLSSTTRSRSAFGLVLVALTCLIPIHSTLLAPALTTLISSHISLPLLVLLPLLLHHHELHAATRSSYRRAPNSALVATELPTLHAALLLVPLLVLLGWAIDRPVTLEAPGLLPLVAAGAGAWASGVVLQDGRGNYLKGAILLVLYFSFTIAAWLLPVK